MTNVFKILQSNDVIIIIQQSIIKAKHSESRFEEFPAGLKLSLSHFLSQGNGHGQHA